MSSQALGWVFEDSPMKGATFLVHLAIADITNDAHDNELWCSTTAIAKKCRLTRFQVGRSLTSLCDAGLLELLEKRPGRTDKYRFILPGPVTQSHRSAHDVGNEPVTAGHSGVTDGHSTCDSGSHELNRTQADNFFASPIQKRDPDPECPRCQGTGGFFNATAGADCACPCVWEEDYEPRTKRKGPPPGWVNPLAVRREATA